MPSGIQGAPPPANPARSVYDNCSAIWQARLFDNVYRFAVLAAALCGALHQKNWWR